MQPSRIPKSRIWQGYINAASLLVLLCVPGIVYAHALLIRSTPPAYAAVHGPTVQISLHYNSRIDLKRSFLKVTDEAGNIQKLVITTPAGPAELDGEAQGLTPAQYLIHWQVLASDGHITRGEIPFTVE